MAKIWKDKTEPTDKSYIWLRLNNNSNIVGYFKYENDQWVVIPRNKLKELLDETASNVIDTLVNGASENMDTLGEVEQSFLGLATVATTGDYSDLLNKPMDSGDTLSRPTLTSSNIGYLYFDTTLGKPIWFDGTNWVDATGTTV